MWYDEGNKGKDRRITDNEISNRIKTHSSVDLLKRGLRLSCSDVLQG